jgi:sulfite exporter TauE/SafE
MDYSSGFILGLSTGVVCLSYCGPVIMPYLLSEGKSISQNTGTVALFLSGRLLAYLIIGLLAGIIGSKLLQPLTIKNVFIGILYILLGLMMIFYGFHRFKEICLGKKSLHNGAGKLQSGSYMLPLAGGFVTGLNLCPPFLLAITGAMETGNITGSVLFFLTFFLGTVVYFIPLPFIGFFRRQHVLRIIGKFASILAGMIFIYKGFVLLLLNA